MAVGTVSSAQNLVRTAPVTPQLISGEKVTTTASALKDPKAKTYYHQVAGASFFMPNGLQIQFLGGVFTTADQDIIAELDRVADRNSSFIVSDAARKQILELQDKQAASDAAQ